MLTRAQIQRLAQRYGIGVQAQERDYLQHLLLFLLYSKSQSLVFKGGTALRIVYKGNRYSEDLDFNGLANVASIKELWQGVLQDLRDFGVDAEIRYEWQSDVGYSFDVSYQGPLYDGRDRTKGKVRVDVSTRQEKMDTQRELISSEYDDIRPFVATVINLEHLLAEKVRALLMRSKARDAYDIWLLTSQGVRMDRDLVRKKLALYNVALSSVNLEDALEKAKADWTRDLRPLLPQFVTWKDAMAQLSSVFSRLAQ
ncbi:MAG: nucleotidyl transferase AbiEii/AbiGii toxin family protein [Anaerolineales bacterium]|nr:nucleotidyl transferase AbiEii/AbiGii toxin family protein [Anaerolineales bacterium]